MAKDLYEILGVAKTATDTEIKSAYRKLAIKMHPDKFTAAGESEKKEAEKKFKEINHAYEILSDQQKRSNYDQFGNEDGPQGFGGFGGGGDASSFGGGFEDILSSFFGGSFGGGGRANPNGAKQGEDIQIRVNLTFEEAYNGVKKTVVIRRDEICADCDGSGAKDSSSVKTCDYCKGTGYVRRVQNSIFGQQVVQSVCNQCGGKGKIIESKCKTCKGNGFVNKEATITVNIPAGVDSGVSMTIRNEGNCGKNGGARGNLIMALVVSNDERFRRVGSDLYMELPMSFFDATNGCEIEVKTMKGWTKCKVPSSTQSATKIRMKNYGMKILNKEAYGDLYLTVKVETPKSLNKKQLDLLKNFEDSLSDAQYPSVKKFKSIK